MWAAAQETYRKNRVKCWVLTLLELLLTVGVLSLLRGSLLRAGFSEGAIGRWVMAALVLLCPLTLGYQRCLMRFLLGAERVPVGELFYFYGRGKRLGRALGMGLVRVLIFRACAILGALAGLMLVGVTSRWSRGIGAALGLVWSLGWAVFEVWLFVTLLLWPAAMIMDPELTLGKALTKSGDAIRGWRWSAFFTVLGVGACMAALSAVVVMVFQVVRRLVWLPSAVGTAAVGVLFVLLMPWGAMVLGRFALDRLGYPRNSGRRTVPKDSGDAGTMAENLLEISQQMNRYEGMRSNAAMEMYAGPSPRDLVPPPPVPPEDRAEWEAVEPYCDEPYDAEIDVEGGAAAEPESETAARLREGLRLEPGALHWEGRVTSWKAPLGLLEQTGWDPAFRECPPVRRQVQRLYRMALEDLNGYPEEPREGVAAEIFRVRGNRFRLVLRLREEAGEKRPRLDLYWNEK